MAKFLEKAPKFRGLTNPAVKGKKAQKATGGLSLKNPCKK